MPTLRPGATRLLNSEREPRRFIRRSPLQLLASAWKARCARNGDAEPCEDCERPLFGEQTLSVLF